MPVPGGRPPKLAGLEAEIVAAYEAGADVHDLARRYGVSASPIRRIVGRDAGVIRPAHRPRLLSAEQVDEAVGLWHREWNLAAIGRRFHVHANVIRRELQERGIDTTARPIVRRGMDR